MRSGFIVIVGSLASWTPWGARWHRIRQRPPSSRCGVVVVEAPAVLVPVQVTWSEYDGLRVMLDLLGEPSGAPIVIDLHAVGAEHPAWIESLSAAREWLARLLFSVQREGRLARTSSARDLAATRRATAKALRLQGHALRDIADRLGVSVGTVSSYCKGQPRRRARATR